MGGSDWGFCTASLDRIAVPLTETLQTAGLVAVGVAFGGWLGYHAVALAILNWGGASARGVVVRSVQNDDGEGGIFYVVSYEFTATKGSESPRACTGKQRTRYAFRAKDVVAVRYWSKWPRISQIVERGV